MEELKINIKPNYSTYRRYKDKNYLNELQTILEDIGEVEVPEQEMSNSVGVTLWEVIVICLALKAGGTIAKGFLEQIGQDIAVKLEEWIKKRVEKKEGPIQKTHATIYGPDGEILKIVSFDKNGKLEDELLGER